MPDPYAKAQPGQPVVVAASVWNAMLDAARAHQAQQANRGTGDLDQFRQGDIVRVKNQTGSDLGIRSVLGLDGPIIAPADDPDGFLQAVTFRGVVPGSGHAGRFAILLEPAPADQVVRAFVAGVCQVQIDVIDEAHTCAEVATGETDALVSVDSGSAQILWKQGDEGYGYETGVQWAIVRFGTACGG